MRRLYARPRPAPDARPALLSVAALMVVLVPLVLLTSTGQKATGVALGLPGPGEDVPPPPPGPVESLRVEGAAAGGFLVQAAVRRTDVLASAGDVERQELVAADLAALQAHLRTLKALDPQRQRLTLAPGPDTPAGEVVAWMDAVRADGQGPLYPEVLVEAATGEPGEGAAGTGEGAAGTGEGAAGTGEGAAGEGAAGEAP